MNFKTTSSRAVLARIGRVYKPEFPGWRVDAMEYIGEALGLIGAGSGTYKKSTPHPDDPDAFEIEGHRGLLPCDLESILMVEYRNRHLPYGGDITLPGLVCDPDGRSTLVKPSPSDTSPDVIAGNSAADYVNDSPLRISGHHGTTVHDYYQVNPDYIITSFEEGTIRIYYNAFHTDKDGFPMIPDTPEFKIALSWYVLLQMMYGGYKHPTLNIRYVEEKWERFSQMAGNSAMFPSIDKMELFRRMWTRVIPRDHLHDDFFIGEENREEW